MRTEFVPYYVYAGLDEKNQRLSRMNIHENTFEYIINQVGDALKLDPFDIVGKSRKRPLVEARFICIGLLLESNPKLTLQGVGKLFSRDHSTIIYNREMYFSLKEIDKTFSKKLQKCLSVI